MPKLNVVAGIINQVADKIDDFTLDKAEKAELMQEINKAQLEVNKVEAGQTGLLGWVLSLAFAYHFVLQPFLVFALAANGIVVELPQFDMGTMTTVLMGMLGMAGMRTYEKVKQSA